MLTEGEDNYEYLFLLLEFLVINYLGLTYAQILKIVTQCIVDFISL